MYTIGNIQSIDVDTYKIMFDQPVHMEDMEDIDELTCHLCLITSTNKKITVILYDISPDKQTIYVRGEIHEEDDIYQGQILVYGQKVDNFRTIDTDAVHNFGIAAIQELSKQLQETKNEVATLKEQMAVVLQKLQM